MRKLIAISILTILTNLSFGQNNLKDKLEDVFTENKVSAILADSQKKQYYQNVMFNSFELITVDDKTSQEANYPVLKTIKITDRNNKTTTETDAVDVEKQIENGEFNILLTNVKRAYSEKTYYKIANTNQVLVVYSYQQLSNK